MVAAIVTSTGREDTPVSVAYEVFYIDMNGATTATITPTSIKSIDSVYVTALDADAMDSTYVSTFIKGSGTCVITSDAGGLLAVKIEGKIA